MKTKPTLSPKQRGKYQYIKTLVAVPDGYHYIEVLSFGRIITKPVKVKNGSSIKVVILGEL